MIIDAVIAENDSDLDDTPLSENADEEAEKICAEFLTFCVALLFTNITAAILTIYCQYWHIAYGIVLI